MVDGRWSMDGRLAVLRRHSQSGTPNQCLLIGRVSDRKGVDVATVERSEGFVPGPNVAVEAMVERPDGFVPGPDSLSGSGCDAHGCGDGRWCDARWRHGLYGCTAMVDAAVMLRECILILGHPGEGSEKGPPGLAFIVVIVVVVAVFQAFPISVG